jgi:glycerate dehydrogenase
MHGVILDSKTIGKGVDLEPITDLLDSWDVFELTTSSETNKRISNADVVLTNKVKIDKSNLRSAEKLQFVSVLATGTDHIDLNEAF